MSASAASSFPNSTRSADGTSGGSPEFIPLLARAACAAGCDALFVETHPEPAKALSDARSMLSLRDLRRALEGAVAVARAVRAAEGGTA